MNMNISEIRRANARELLMTECGGQQKSFAERVKRDESQISAIIGLHPTRNIGMKIARLIERRFQKPKDWLDKIHSDSNAAAEAPQSSEVNDVAVQDQVRHVMKLFYNLPQRQQDIVRSALAITANPLGETPAAAPGANVTPLRRRNDDAI